MCMSYLSTQTKFNLNSISITNTMIDGYNLAANLEILSCNQYILKLRRYLKGYSMFINIFNVLQFRIHFKYLNNYFYLSILLLGYLNLIYSQPSYNTVNSFCIVPKSCQGKLRANNKTCYTKIDQRVILKPCQRNADDMEIGEMSFLLHRARIRSLLQQKHR